MWVFSSDFSKSLQTSHDFSIGMGHNPFLPLVTVKITMISMDLHSRCRSIPTRYLWRKKCIEGISHYIPGLVDIQKTMEHHHFLWVNPLKIAIFNSYVSLPEGSHCNIYWDLCAIVL